MKNHGSSVAEETNMTNTAIRIENLTRTFDGQSGTVRAVDRLSLEVPSGTIRVFGPQRRGKASLEEVFLTLMQEDES